MSVPPNLAANAGKGRTPGVPNRSTRRIRDAVSQALNMAGPSIARWLEEVGRKDPAHALHLAAQLARVVMPKAGKVPTGTVDEPGHIARARAREAPELQPRVHARAREDGEKEGFAELVHRLNRERSPPALPGTPVQTIGASYSPYDNNQGSNT